MTKDDFKRFGVIWNSAHGVYGKAVEPQTIALVFKILAGYELAHVEAALAAHLKNCEFAPKPADVVRRIEGDQDAHVALAWSEFRQATRSGEMPADEAVCAAIRRMGGLELLGERTPRDLDFMRDSFAALFLAARNPMRLGIVGPKREALEAA